LKTGKCPLGRREEGGVVPRGGCGRSHRSTGVFKSGGLGNGLTFVGRDVKL